MEPIESNKMDLFQSLKSETLDSSDEGPSTSYKSARKLSEVKSKNIINLKIFYQKLLIF